MAICDKQKMIQVSDTWEFYDLFDRLLCVQGIPEEKISEGLCSVSLISRIRNGERIPNKMMRDRLVARLGLADERNENFLCYEEYAKWKLRYQILQCIEEDAFAEAEKLLENFAGDEEFHNPLEQQFYCMMQVQLLSVQEGKKSEICALLERAVRLTMPAVLDGKKSVSELLLSNQEINILLEYVKQVHPEQLVKACEALLQYITNADWDDDTKAKIYPKVVYYECESAFSTDVDYAKLLEHCDGGIECLRKTEKMYYLWELLNVREHIYRVWIPLIPVNDVKKADCLRIAQNVNQKWKRALEMVYSLSELRPQMKSDCYFYMQQEMYCINDVIRHRREMFGMTKKQLSENICSEKTVGRLERYQSKVQMPIAKQLFEKLNLSGEYQRADIVTNQPEVLEWLSDFVLSINNYELETALHILQNIENHISMEIPLNRQFIHLMKSRLQYGQESSEKLFEEAKIALEYTVSEKRIFESEILYLTNGELTCLYHMARDTGTEKMNHYFELLLRICEEWEKNEEVGQHMSMYSLFMKMLASVIGNVGSYDRSDQTALTAIKINVQCRKLGQIQQLLYCMIWNDIQREKRGIQMENFCIPIAFEDCISLSDLFGKKYYKVFLEEKLREYTN